MSFTPECASIDASSLLYRYRRPTPNQPNPHFDRPSRSTWDTPFNESFAANSNLSHCVPERREEIIEHYWRRRWVSELMLANVLELKPYLEATFNWTENYYAEHIANLPHKGNFSAL